MQRHVVAKKLLQLHQGAGSESGFCAKVLEMEVPLSREKVGGVLMQGRWEAWCLSHVVKAVVNVTLMFGGKVSAVHFGFTELLQFKW